MLYEYLTKQLLLYNVRENELYELKITVIQVLFIV